MRFKLPAAMTVLMLLSAVPVAVHAQTHRMHIGPHLSYNFDASKFGVGGQFSAPVAHHLEFYPSADFFFVSPGSLFSVNADLKYRLSGEAWTWLYLGGGLNLSHASAAGASKTTAGVNLIAGAESLKSMVHPFGEIRLTVGDGSTAQIALGLNFTLANR
jgi:hypothetical protein